MFSLCANSSPAVCQSASLVLQCVAMCWLVISASSVESFTASLLKLNIYSIVRVSSRLCMGPLCMGFQCNECCPRSSLCCAKSFRCFLETEIECSCEPCRPLGPFLSIESPRSRRLYQQLYFVVHSLSHPLFPSARKHFFIRIIPMSLHDLSVRLAILELALWSLITMSTLLLCMKDAVS